MNLEHARSRDARSRGTQSAHLLQQHWQGVDRLAHRVDRLAHRVDLLVQELQLQHAAAHLGGAGGGGWGVSVVLRVPVQN